MTGFGKLMRFLAVFWAMTAGLFVIAGRVDWYELWIFSVIYSIYMIIWFVRMRKRAPDLLKERMEGGFQKAEDWDRFLMKIYYVLIVLFFVTCAVDAGRYNFSRVALTAKAGAGAVIVFILFWLGAVLKANTYLSSFARIQSDRGQKVVSHGPYAVVRHPMYFALILLFPSISLVLGSYFGLLPSIIIAALFVVRTSLEDQMLSEKLEGYDEYSQKVRFRLIPLIW